MANQGALPENLFDVTSVGRTWNGVAVVITEFFGTGRVLHQLAHDEHSRLAWCWTTSAPARRHAR